MDRGILHCDLNSFYASVEILYRPELKGKAVAVGGREENRQGVILAKTYLAKKLGVKSGETIREAKRKCPELIIIHPNYNRYFKYSKLVREIYYKYTDRVESYGLDECWLDITESRNLFGTDYEIADKIRKHVKKKTGLTISVGVSFNKIFAKMGSDIAKPDSINVINRDSFKEKLWHLNVIDLFGVGASSAKTLNKNNIFKISDLANSSDELLRKILGKSGLVFKNWANGSCNSEVRKYYEVSDTKSIGRGRTTSKDLVNYKEVRHVLRSLSESVADNLRKKGLFALGVQIVVKNNKYKSFQFQSKLNYLTQNSTEILEKAFELFRKKYNFDNNVRALSVRAINLKSINAHEQILFFENYEKHKKLEDIDRTIMEIRDKYGKEIIKYASEIEK